MRYPLINQVMPTEALVYLENSGTELIIKSLFISTLRPGGSYMRLWAGSSFVQVMTCHFFSTNPFTEPIRTRIRKLFLCPVQLYNKSGKKHGLIKWCTYSQSETKTKVHEYRYHQTPPVEGHAVPDSKVHGAHTGPNWGRQDPVGLHVGPMNFAIWGLMSLS